VLAPDPVELRFEVGALEIVQRDRVDNYLVRRGLGPLVHLQHKPRADRALDAVRAKAHQVLALSGIVGVVPVADVDEVDRIRWEAARPLDELGQRARGRLRSEQTGRLGVADVQQVRQRIVGADRVDEVTLQALRDQDGRHLTPPRVRPGAAPATPTLGPRREAALAAKWPEKPACPHFWISASRACDARKALSTRMFLAAVPSCSDRSSDS
jgi:hypothetical protein